MNYIKFLAYITCDPQDIIRYSRVYDGAGTLLWRSGSESLTSNTLGGTREGEPIMVLKCAVNS